MAHRDTGRWPPLPSGARDLGLHRAGEQQLPRAGTMSNGYNSSPATHQQGPSGGPVLPPPSGPFYQGNPQNAQNLPTIAGINQPPPNIHHHRQPHPSHDQNMVAQAQGIASQPQNYPLPSLGQAPQGQQLQQQPNYEREREMQEREREARERDYNEQLARDRRDREARDREMRERSHREQIAPHQSHAEPLQIHQPSAVGPQVRSAIHGPNGILSNGGPSGGPIQPTGPMYSPHYEQNRLNLPPQAQQILPQQMLPFGNGPGMPHMPVNALAQGQQPILNDALSYLDQVKVQFHGEPNVYNQFLDIMKDFKSQAIDTPGVIRRVSSLFQGNPNLIQGFNTFLPPGYRIECGTDGDPNAIRVTTPMGTTVSPMGSALRPLTPPRGPGDMNVPRGQYQPSRPINSIWPPQEGVEPQDGGLETYQSPAWEERRQTSQHQHHAQAAQLSGPSASIERATPVQSHAYTDNPANLALLAHQQEQRGVSQLQNAVSVATGEPVRHDHQQGSPVPDAAGLPGGGASSNMSMQQSQMEKRGPVEFNHAISYVNKIKNRFSSQPEIYKQFLEILQTYQRESKPIQDVYAQVTHLFNGAPDLLEDFKQFLPESAAHAKAAAARQAAEDATMLSNMRGDAGTYQTMQSQQTPRAEPHRLPPVGNFAPTPSAGRDAKRKRGDRQGNAQAALPNSSSAAADYGNSSTSKNGFVSNKRAKPIPAPQQPPAKVQVQIDAPPVSPTLVPALPEPMAPNTTTAATPDEVAFFDRVKKFIGNKSIMNEFLKLCNLYSQDLIDKNVLVFRVQNFIGTNSELFNWFKSFVGYDGKDQIIENRARPVTGRVTLNNCRGLGPSYRYLPKRERLRPCSGRDEMCNSVLNDEWASHPTWASEDSGFISHRKNIHEEGLHRIEEERHDYDHNIFNLERLIRYLEPLSQQNRSLTDEDRLAWTLPREFGGQSHALYKKIIGKLYGRDYAIHIMNDLSMRPGNVVPVLLIRCRMILESWKASQREWEKVWRDQTQRMFWKSLDHQGINAKMADKRQFQTKTLQNEIHVKYEEQKRLRLIPGTSVAKHQAEYVFGDMDVLMDASHLLLSFAEQGHATDLPRLVVFIKEFIPLFFGLDPEAFQQRIREVFGSTPPNEELDEDTVMADDSTAPRGRKMNGRKGDLLRDVLERGRSGKPRDDAATSRSRASTPDVSSTVADDDSTAMDGVEQTKSNAWITHPVEGNVRKKQNIKPNEPYKRTVFNLYANLPIYCFFRMFVILYQRLHNLKLAERDVHDTVRRCKAPKAAIELRVIEKHPENYFADISPTANYYHQVLNMLEDLVKGEPGMDMAYIEEVLRRYYLQNGWMLYSFDKMLSALVRFAIAILGNDGKEKSWEILQLFQKDRRKEMTTHQDELSYRKQVEKYVKDGDVYRISYYQSTSMATIRILKNDETTFGSADEDGVFTAEQRWAYYITSYTSLEPTEGVDQSKLAPSLLKRNLRALPNSAASPGSDDVHSGDAARGSGQAGAATPSDAASARRLDRIRSREGLGLRISPDTYKIFWSVRGSEEWWVSPDPVLATASTTVAGAAGSAAAGKATPTQTATPTAADAITTTTDAAATPAEAPTTTDANGDAEATEASAADAEVDTTTAGGPEHDHDAELLDSRAGAFEEKFVMNNAWMAGLSKGEVDARNADFRRWRDSGSVAGKSSRSRSRTGRAAGAAVAAAAAATTAAPAPAPAGAAGAPAAPGPGGDEAGKEVEGDGDAVMAGTEGA